MFEADFGTALNRWPLVRLHRGSRVECVLLSRAFFAISTHYVRVTVLCSGDACALCEVLPRRGLFYVACACQGRVSLLELGSQSAAELEQHCKLLHGGMQQGQILELTRSGAKKPVRTEVLGNKEGVSAVTQLSLAAHVMAVYKLPPPNPTEDLERYEARLVPTVARRCDQLAKQVLNGNYQGV